MLLARGADINETYAGGNTVLLAAAIGGDVEMFKLSEEQSKDMIEVRGVLCKHMAVRIININEYDISQSLYA